MNYILYFFYKLFNLLDSKALSFFYFKKDIRLKNETIVQIILTVFFTLVLLYIYNHII